MSGFFYHFSCQEDGFPLAWAFYCVRLLVSFSPKRRTVFAFTTGVGLFKVTFSPERRTVFALAGGNHVLS